MLLSWVNGRPCNTLAITDRGLAYGDGVFETMRLSEGAIPLFRFHLERLLKGCRFLNLSVDGDTLHQQVLDFAGQATKLGHPNSVIKLMVTRGSGGRGYSAMGAQNPSILLQLHPLPEMSLDALELSVCHHRLSDNPVLAGHKHLNRIDNVLLQWECDQRGENDGIALDQHENIVETVSSNIVFAGVDGWITPSLDRCGVSGVMLRYLSEYLFPRRSESLRTQRIPVASIASFRGGFVCNSVRGIRPIRQIGSHRYTASDVDDRVGQLQQAFQELLSRGSVE